MTKVPELDWHKLVPKSYKPTKVIAVGRLPRKKINNHQAKWVSEEKAKYLLDMKMADKIQAMLDGKD